MTGLDATRRVVVLAGGLPAIPLTDVMMAENVLKQTKGAISGE